jgi:1-acyl-sn-glycerol-3-phosphate acyltransferase
MKKASSTPKSKAEIVPRHTWVFRFMGAMFRAYLRLGSWKVHGLENVPTSGPVILAPNHVSLLDPPLVGVSCGRWPFTMGKAELFHGAQGWAFQRMGCFPIKRGAPDRTAFKRARQILKDGHPLLIFPEGTRTRTGELGEAETGVAMLAHGAKAAVVPVWIAGTEASLSPANKKLRRVRVEVTFGKPIDFSEEYARKADRETLDAMGARVMTAIAELRDGKNR